MGTSPTFTRNRVARLAARRACRVLTTLLLPTISAACARFPISTAIAPRVTPSSDTLSIRSTMTSATTLPGHRVSTSVPLMVPIRWRHSYAGATVPLPPMLMLIDGVPLGLRPDSTVDHDAAKRLMQRIRCKDVVSIQVVRGEQAVRRFGRVADPGVIMVVTASHTWRAEAGNP